MSLMKRFFNDRFLQIRSFSLCFLTAAALCALLYAWRDPDSYAFHFAWWQLALVPLGIYIGGVSAVFIHNATHDSFPGGPWVNWACGQLAGMHQLWGFTGWKIIHLVHHQYSDNGEMDPHAPRNLTFTQFCLTMFTHSSQTISTRYREHWGDTGMTSLLQRGALAVFFATAGANLLLWYLLLGPAGFVFFYVPSYIANHLLFCHINYYCHPKNAAGESKPANLTQGLYYRLANLAWSGIYYHENHHRRPMLFNPKYMAV